MRPNPTYTTAAEAGLGAATGPRRRRLTAVAVLAVLLVCGVILSLAIGAKSIPIETVLEAVISRGPSADHATIWDGRMPRTALAVVAGIALAVAGALMQAITRNPLADPGVLGVNAGAAFAVVIAVGFLGWTAPLQYIWFSFAGALAVALMVYYVGTGGRSNVDPVRLTLAGVALGAVLTGIGEGLALLRPQAFDRMRVWMIGSVDIRSFEPTLWILPFVAAGLLLALGAGSPLNAIALGDDQAASLGVDVSRTRIACVAAITLLAGSATAAAGSIAFVGLMIPHAARWVSGPDQRWIIALSALMGPILMLYADVLGRVIVAGEMPVGVVTALVGAPVLIMLARRRRVAHL